MEYARNKIMYRRVDMIRRQFIALIATLITLTILGCGNKDEVEPTPPGEPNYSGTFVVASNVTSNNCTVASLATYDAPPSPSTILIEGNVIHFMGIQGVWNISTRRGMGSEVRICWWDANCTSRGVKSYDIFFSSEDNFSGTITHVCSACSAGSCTITYSVLGARQ